MSSQVTGTITHPVVGAVAAAFDGFGAVRDAALFGLADEDVEAAIEGCHGVRARVFDTELALVAEADGRDLGRRVGAASTAAWLRDRFRIRPGDARRLVEVANRMRVDDGPVDYAANVRGSLSGRELPATAAALAEGVISPEHVAVVAKVMRTLPTGVPVDKAQEVEAIWPGSAASSTRSRWPGWASASCTCSPGTPSTSGRTSGTAAAPCGSTRPPAASRAV
ncbi:MAG TPA: DUF222 domain-containing protein [Jiangellaceae bacterium]